MHTPIIITPLSQSNRSSLKNNQYSILKLKSWQLGCMHPECFMLISGMELAVHNTRSELRNRMSFILMRPTVTSNNTLQYCLMCYGARLRGTANGTQFQLQLKAVMMSLMLFWARAHFRRAYRCDIVYWVSSWHLFI
jgi:hypothetical protein